uniref:Ribosome maturation protein SBDS n=1 Tax=Metchnikovella dogieli TaxID=2804710 RepID=A0A896WBI0_9MICR|nr:Ribosome maturation protein SBDS [Metchnikovella dogieli]
MRIFTPCNKIKLENVSCVQFKKNGMRFELACHTNKLYDYQNNLIRSEDDVVQTKSIFKNISKGLLASKEELSAGFGNIDINTIIKEILSKGILQLSHKERGERLEKMQKEISHLIAELCFNPESGLPYSPKRIEWAMAEAQVSINVMKSTKQQALKIIQVLEAKKTIPIEKKIRC